MLSTLKTTAIGLALLLSTSANAALLTVSQYDMPNGDGQAHGGTFNYWDRNYSGLGSTTTDGAALTGGLGKLTDGIISTSPWFNVSNNAGTGEYVGWINSNSLNPTVTFTLAGSSIVNAIDIQLDNTGVGGVFAPRAILVDGNALAWTAPALGTVGVVSFTGLNLAGSTHTIQFIHANQWVFVSEVQFYGVASGIPEPATWAMMLIGFAGLGVAARRRKMATA